MQADYISDTHINLWKMKTQDTFSLFPTLSPNLILAGDIGDPDEPGLHALLDSVRRRYKRIIYVPGNHEFYKREAGSKKTPASVLSWFEKLDTQWDNFHFFYRRAEVIDGVRVLGATGWTTSPKSTEWASTISQEGKNDVLFLNDQIARSKENVLVVTHYPPTLQVLSEDYKDSIHRFDYAQDLEYMFRPPLDTWIFGHIHQRHRLELPYSSMMVGSGIVRLLCNPYGYPHEGAACTTADTVYVPKASR